MECTHRKLSFEYPLLTLGHTTHPPPPPRPHPHPIKFLLNFSEMNYHLHLPFSVVVHISLTHILTQDWWALVAMVMRYDVISSRWGSHFWRKMRVFSPFSGDESTNCARKAVKCLIISHFLMFCQKCVQFSPFPVKFPILVKSKMAATFDGVTGPQQCHSP